MTSNGKRIVWLALVAGGGALGLFERAVARADAAPLVVVVGKDVPITEVSRADLRRVFMGETTVVSGETVAPFNATANTKERITFDQAILGFSADQVTKYWIDRRIRGQGNPPRSVSTPDVQARMAAKFPRAITYVPLDVVTPDLKVLRIDGKLPSDPGYLLAGD